MPLLAWIIALLITTENITPLIAGYVATPKDMVFLGTTHHPADYFYYLSQFAQGTHRTLTSIDLYTSEHVSPTYVGWINVLIGKIFSLAGLTPTFAYHASVLVGTLLVLYLAYKLAFHIQKSTLWATVSLYFFGLFHAFSMVRDGVPSFGDYWNNLAIPRVRFGAVPHQLMQTAASLSLILFVLQWWHQPHPRTKKSLALIGIASAILSSLQPALWGLTVGVMIVTVIFFILKNKSKIKHLSIYSTPISITMLSGIIPALYLNNLFTTLPFSQLKLWEVAQQTPFTLHHFISATGPIFLIAFVAFPFVFKPTLPLLFTTFSLVASYLLFLSPIPHALGISHARVINATTILLVCVVAVEGIKLLSVRLPKRFAFATTLFIIAGLTVYLLPNHFKSLELATTFSTKNAYHYLYKDDYALLQHAGNAGILSDTYLVIWPYNVVFPALTGKRSFHGHPLLTIHPEEKNRLADAFFAQQMDEQTLRKFLADYGITRVIAYSWTTFPQGLIKNPSSGGMLTSFEVNTDYLKTYSK